MDAFRRRHLAARLALAASIGVAGAAGCSLGLDKSLLDADGGDDDVTTIEAATEGAPRPGTDAPASDAPVTPGGDAGACATDSDCQSAVGDAGSCVKSATCDPTSHVCILDSCDVGACKAAVCNASMQACTVPSSYGFQPARFTVSLGGVGGPPNKSLAAVWPFVFVVTTNGVAAYNVVDPTNTMPPAVDVRGVPFIPVAAVAVGRRVYFTTATEGNGPTYRQAVAWIDVPQNPFLTSLQATTAWVGTPQQYVQNVLTNGVDGLFVVYGTGSLLPTAIVAPPLTDLTVLSPDPNAGLPSGASIAAASGSRLVTYRYASDINIPNLALVNAAGTTSAQTTSEQPITAFGPTDNQPAFGTGGDGSLLWSDAVFEVNDGGTATGVLTAQLAWILDNGTAANFDTTTVVDLATYVGTGGVTLVGPPLWIDANTALGLAAASATSLNSTSVQVVTKQPPTVETATRTLISVAPTAVGVAASNGFGYVLAEDDPQNQTCSVTIFAPSCTSGDP